MALNVFLVHVGLKRTLGFLVFFLALRRGLTLAVCALLGHLRGTHLDVDFLFAYALALLLAVFHALLAALLLALLLRTSLLVDGAEVDFSHHIGALQFLSTEREDFGGFGSRLRRFALFGLLLGLGLRLHLRLSLSLGLLSAFGIGFCRLLWLLFYIRLCFGCLHFGLRGRFGSFGLIFRLGLDLRCRLVFGLVGFGLSHLWRMSLGLLLLGLRLGLVLLGLL